MKLSTLLNMVVWKYFQSFTCVYFINEINEDINFNSVVPTVVVDNVNLTLYFENMKCEGFIIASKNLKSNVVSIENQLKYVSVFRFTRRRYLLVSIQEEDVAVIFDSVVFKNIVDVLVISTSEEERNLDVFLHNECLCFDFFVHKYIGKEINSPVLIDNFCSCNESLALLKILYPNKLQDQCGRIFTVSTYHYTPYVNLESFKGAELSMVTTFIERYNMTAKYIIENEFHSGEIGGDFEGKGSLYRSAVGEADLSVGAYYGMVKRYFYHQFSIPTLRIGLTFLVPVPREAGGLTTPLRPFSTVTWLYFCLVYAGTTVFQYAFYYVYTRLFLHQSTGYDIEPLFFMYLIVLQQHVDIKFRVFGGFALLFGVLFSTFYCSGLASIMTKPSYSNEIKTAEQLENSHIPVIGHSDSYIYDIKSDARYESIVKHFIAMTEDELTQYLKKTTSFATPLDHLDLGYSLGDYETVIHLKELENFRLLKEDVSYEYCVFLGYKHSVIMPLLNHHMLNLKESGLDYYWQSEGFREMDYKMQLYLKYEYSQTTIKLSWRNVEGAFEFLGIGLSISMIRFLYELLKYYKFCNTNYY